MIDRATPVAVTGITNARDLAAGNAHTCARTATGEILCWGTNGSYQLGAGSGVTGSPTPLMTVGIDDAVQVDAGSLHGCALRATGEVACWGTNIDGQVGDGTSTLFHPTPVAVPGLVDAVEIALSSTHSCARRATGAVVCWGDNAAGGLGDGTTTNSRSPVTVLDGSMDLAGGRHIGTGYTHSCAQTGSFGGYMCWGGNVQGQLGVGDFVDRTTATLVFDLP
jgi:alpha-tubulin suppressor-like RCC1 family protein